MKVKLASLLAGWLDIPLPESVNISLDDLVIDSRQVKPGCVFVAVLGTLSDGRLYIDKAIANGAVGVLAQTLSPEQDGTIEQRNGVPVIYCYGLKMQLATLAKCCFGPLPEYVIGVTGTNGKSTTTHLLASLANQHNIPAALMGTLGNGRPGQLHRALNTTADIFTIYRTLSQFAAQGIQLVAMEVSSHGLDQGRVAGIDFKAAIFTNLTRDHLDYHGTMQAYGQAKEQLFDLTDSQVQLVNCDDPFGLELLARHPHAVSYGQNVNSDWQAEIVAMTPQGVQISVYHGEECYALDVPLLGEFNVSNLLAAASCLDELGLVAFSQLTDCDQLKTVPGRMELFNGCSQAVVDYAHTPDALAKALQGLRSHCQGKLYCIFGCGGDRDSGKRPLMAQAAEHYADVVIVTNDNPRTEPAEQIAQDICRGFSDSFPYSVILDRRTAIKTALEQAGHEDMVLVAGKGHEDYQIIGHDKFPYDERSFVAQAVKECLC
ncbi:UDP-N-acetylmuramoylalanyl-D-glutamate--2,6-diaminopimelate ligase [Celerinatantimonas diazotrophica]|uniref:UDP-N-acetylmuramoyl-L-alanyl-D-glutamate--2,6-diaminopimelate ligase n=2 Tax=Celerinatantimonas diazotrophica TaxID=412034 RepID=A0A4R1K4M1_9GAMM|nr:UDP-N-acetylmuramoylalanyl-D-glutamate--2,6-diaminopimelate ligase [Celerinatantimonas diazotrophica]CAG9297972.1 UDP-N-acetylmuramoyl-L-alanyl-D-glutamate--2, 6-diaminopimelate ligase [Celerinatantimonas diazotrophica]